MFNLKLVLLAGFDPASFGYQPKAFPLSYRRFENGGADGCCPRYLHSDSVMTLLFVLSSLNWHRVGELNPR